VIAEDEIARFREMGVKGLGLLSRLQKSFPFSLNESAVTLFTCLSSYSDASDPWTSPKAQSQAHDLLEDHIDAIRLPALITDLLKERVRPLFAKSKIPAITPQARKAVDPRPSDDTAHSDLDAKLKPWKYLDVYIVTVFQWILGQLNVRLMESILRSR